MTAQRQERNDWRLRGRLIGLLAAICAFGAVVSAARAATTERVVVDRFSGLALGGVDPVSYFTEGRPVQGRPDVEASEAGAVWRFRNDGNRAFFLAHPEIYGPQFGGYDPVDVARGVAFAGRPQLWLIVGQRLYLFGHAESRDAFAANPSAILSKAGQCWLELRETLGQ